MCFPSISTTKEYKLAAVYHFCCNFKMNNYVYVPFFISLKLILLPGSEKGPSNY